jgi:hypothetical protein
MNHSRAPAHEVLGTRSTARVTANTNKATATITTKVFIDRVIPTSPPFHPPLLRRGVAAQWQVAGRAAGPGLEGAGPQEEPDPRLTSHYLRTDRRTVVTRLLVPSPLESSSVCVLNSVPRYFMGLRALMSLASGAGPLGPTASWFMGFPPSSSTYSLQGGPSRRVHLSMDGN